jgi:hypothetical protein
VADPITLIYAHDAPPPRYHGDGLLYVAMIRCQPHAIKDLRVDPLLARKPIQRVRPCLDFPPDETLHPNDGYVYSSLGLAQRKLRHDEWWGVGGGHERALCDRCADV